MSVVNIVFKGKTLQLIAGKYLLISELYKKVFSADYTCQKTFYNHNRGQIEQIATEVYAAVKDKLRVFPQSNVIELEDARKIRVKDLSCKRKADELGKGTMVEVDTGSSLLQACVVEEDGDVIEVLPVGRTVTAKVLRTVTFPTRGSHGAAYKLGDRVEVMESAGRWAPGTVARIRPNNTYVIVLLNLQADDTARTVTAKIYGLRDLTKKRAIWRK